MLHRTKTFTLQQSQHKDIQENIQSSKIFIFRGLFSAFISGILFSISAVIVKQLQTLHPGQLAVYRLIFISACSLPAAVSSQENFMGPRSLRHLLILIGLFTAANVYLSTISFRYLPLGEANVIIFSTPVFVLVGAKMFLKEPFGLFQTITVLLTVIGIILTTKIPLKLSGNSIPLTKESLYGIIAAVASMLISTFACILIRKVKNVHHAIIVFYTNCVATIGVLIITAVTEYFKWHDCGLQGWYIITLGIVSYCAQMCSILALQYELAGPVSAMTGASDIVFSFVWQIVLYRDVPDTLSISGAVLVGLSVILVGICKWLSSP